MWQQNRKFPVHSDIPAREKAVMRERTVCWRTYFNQDIVEGVSATATTALVYCDTQGGLYTAVLYTVHKRD